MNNAPRIYNLFPRLAGPMDKWKVWFDHASDLLFDWVYINPFHYPGFSGSLYAVKDYGKLNPIFIPESWQGTGDELDYLKILVKEAKARGLKLMMDLVINHTAKDSILADEHPEWYVRDKAGRIVSPSAIDPADARKVTVWGDLADIDNKNSPDRDNLWNYWIKLVERFVELGFEGFRCDAAYHVPSELWSLIIGRARELNPGCLFWAETLGCRLKGIVDLEEAGFDLIANSSKWWDFSEPWCLKQHEQFKDLAQSVGFPESHDTARLAAETGGLEQVQKQRYLFASVFSAGILMPIGYEFGFRKRLNVVKTGPGDMEKHAIDISEFIREVNDLKCSFPIFQSDGSIEALWGLDGPVLCLRKTYGPEKLLIIINKNWNDTEHVEIPDLETLTGSGHNHQLLISKKQEDLPDNIFRKVLKPCEIVLIYNSPATASNL